MLAFSFKIRKPPSLQVSTLHERCIETLDAKPMSDLAILRSATDEFFRRHWPAEILSFERPDWKNWDSFLYGSVPNHDLGGCYALFCKNQLLYVGLGASKGTDRYRDHGISRRLMAHVLGSDRQRGPQWLELTRFRGHLIF